MIRHQCAARDDEDACPCCGKKFGTRMIELIDGHLALREMGLIEGPAPLEDGPR